MNRLGFLYCLSIAIAPSVKGHRFTLRCTPQTDLRQQILRLETQVSPRDFLSQGQDQWGNAILYGCCREKQDHFDVRVSGEAMTGCMDAALPADPKRDIVFRYPTELTMPDAALREFAAKLRLAGADPLEQACFVMESVHGKMRYAPGTTDVRTTAAQAFAAGAGVCQDYAHVMLALVRQLEIPARYAAGMLLGEGESHAWVEVLCGGRWYPLDPTNCQRVTDQHIQFSRGRDARECAINRGIFYGTGTQTAQVSVVVREM